jgi:tRNA G26 N,N-dimethylase Trm1
MTPRAKCLQAIQLLARVSAASDEGYCECVSCGAINHFARMDGGHFIPKGASSYWALDFRNVHPQCKSCNAYGMKHGSAAQQYTLWMQDYYGRDFVEEMFEKKRNMKKLYKKDYTEILKELNQQILVHKKRIGSYL